MDFFQEYALKCFVNGSTFNYFRNYKNLRYVHTPFNCTLVLALKTSYISLLCRAGIQKVTFIVVVGITLKILTTLL